MAFDFPNSPTNGQVFTPPGGPTYTYDLAGTKWLVTGTGLSGMPGASQAQQEAGVSSSATVTPSVQHFHPSAAKVWVMFNPSGGIGTSYNVSSVTDNGTGDWTINIATDFSSANCCALAWGGVHIAAPTAVLIYYAVAFDAGTFTLRSAKDFAGTGAEPDTPALIYFVAFGDQA